MSFVYSQVLEWGKSHLEEMAATSNANGTLRLYFVSGQSAEFKIDFASASWGKVGKVGRRLIVEVSNRAETS